MRDTGTAEIEISVQGLTKLFGAGAAAVRALDGVSVEIGRGEFFTLLGPSGCGKTTLLRLIAGFEQPTAGSLRIGGAEMAGLGPNRRPVNTVFQDYALFPHMTVADNVSFGLRMQGRPRAEVAATTAEVLRLVRMEAMADRRPSQISGGQQQRVALARALAPRPRVLLLDEPLSALDLKLRKEMQGELKRLQAETGITFVFVTHDQEEALTMSDRIAVMSAGRILQTGTPEAIYDRPADRFVADFIGETNFMPATVTDTAGGLVTLTLANGGTVRGRPPAGGAPSPGTRVTAVIRPEQASIADGGPITGTVASSVFFGTDTHLHIRLDPDGAKFILRRQNVAGAPPAPAPGSRVTIAVADGAVQTLRD